MRNDSGRELWGRESNSITSMPLDELIQRAERRNASGEWTAAPMTRAHFEEWATIFQPPDEEEILLFDKPVAEG